MFCKNCGKELPDNSKFCTGCGGKQDVQIEVPVQTTVNPVGQPFEVSNQAIESGEKNSKLKKYLPIIIAVAIAVVAIAVAVTLFFVLDDDSKSERNGKEGSSDSSAASSDSGAKGVINRFENAINDYDAEGTVECFAAYSLFLDEDDFEAIVEIMDERYDNLKYADFEVNFEIKGENDITEDDCDYDDMTCQEYYQEIYETMDEYDGQKIQTVKEVYVKVTCDYNSDYNDKVEDTAENYEAINKFFCVEFNGNWYIAHSDAILE